MAGDKTSIAWRFQSPEAAEICAHLTEEEFPRLRLSLSHRRPVALCCSIAAAAVLFLVVAYGLRWYRKTPPALWDPTNLLFIAFAILATVWSESRDLKRALAATAWARSRGITARRVRLYAFRKGRC